MTESKKTVRIFILTVIWILFIFLTLSGLVYAGEQTSYISNGKEPQTVKVEVNNQRDCTFDTAPFLLHYYC